MGESLVQRVCCPNPLVPCFKSSALSPVFSPTVDNFEDLDRQEYIGDTQTLCYLKQWEYQINILSQNCRVQNKNTVNSATSHHFNYIYIMVIIASNN